MLKIFFYIRAEKVKSNGEAPIYAKVTLGNQNISISTGKYISSERWMFTNKLRNILKLEQEKVLKKSLDLFALNLNKKFNEIYEINPDIDLSILKEEISGKTKHRKSISILDIFDKHNVDFARKVSNNERAAASLQKYKRSADLMKKFIKKNYGRENFDYDEINGAFIHNLESYLKYESEFKGVVGIKNNSVVKYFTNFKTMCNFGIKINLIEKNPFVKYDGRLKVRDATFLTTEELNLIESKTFSSTRLENVKNIFLFSCYTGYAPIDACSLKLSHLIQDNNGMFWIKTDRVTACDKLIAQKNYEKPEYYQVMSDLFKGIFLIILLSILTDIYYKDIEWWKFVMALLIWYRAKMFSAYYVKMVKRSI